MTDFDLEGRPLGANGLPLTGATLASWKASQQRREAEEDDLVGRVCARLGTDEEGVKRLIAEQEVRGDLGAAARTLCWLAARLTGLDADDALSLLGDPADAVRVLRVAGDPHAATVQERAGLEGYAPPPPAPGCGEPWELARRLGGILSTPSR
jgi:hypothetical protein